MKKALWCLVPLLMITTLLASCMRTPAPTVLLQTPPSPLASSTDTPDPTQAPDEVPVALRDLQRELEACLTDRSYQDIPAAQTASALLAISGDYPSAGRLSDQGDSYYLFHYKDLPQGHFLTAYTRMSDEGEPYYILNIYDGKAMNVVDSKVIFGLDGELAVLRAEGSAGYVALVRSHDGAIQSAIEPSTRALLSYAQDHRALPLHYQEVSTFAQIAFIQYNEELFLRTGMIGPPSLQMPMSSAQTQALLSAWKARQTLPMQDAMPAVFDTGIRLILPAPPLSDPMQIASYAMGMPLRSDGSIMIDEETYALMPSLTASLKDRFTDLLARDPFLDPSADLPAILSATLSAAPGYWMDERALVRQSIADEATLARLRELLLGAHYATNEDIAPMNAFLSLKLDGGGTLSIQLATDESDTALIDGMIHKTGIGKDEILAMFTDMQTLYSQHATQEP